MIKKTLIGVALATAMAASSASATPFTRTSPTQGGQLLPGGVSEIGGVVLDMIGLNNARVVAQLSASSLFVGFFDTGSPAAFQGNPGTIGIQTGLTGGLLGALGGGLSELAIRITLADGDTGIGNFDQNDNFLLVNGIEIDDFTAVLAQETTGNGLTQLDPPDPGFENNDLETGFFHETNATVLANIFTSFTSTNEAVYQLRDDANVFDNFFDFTAGVDGSLIDIGQGPVITPPPGGSVPEPATLALFGIGLAGLGFARRRRAA